ncbi:WW domain binding protein 11-domain-containing protein [Pisolithus thermaeus]|nr:WW domain binding protein 11-domain-containing protein [Pisolithus croceorrhizus]KAI6161439.1 WW domain binding protein 11-domain-containing protein [Pisolithus thermaeus]
MTKGKGQNPADAYRKALRKKELKKNKAERTKAREFALVKKDTHDMEDEIKKLETATDLSAADRSRLAELKAELVKVMAKKEEYVKDHPEHRKLVFRQRRDKDSDQPPVPPGEQKRNLFDKRGLPRHPERSIYYDPVMNPYGVPPPGMPYIERPLREDEVASDEGTDDDIVMPAGPPPGSNVENSDGDSDDDIPMPEGLPPSVLQKQSSTLPPPPPPLPTFVPTLQPPPPPPLPSFTSPLPAGFVPPPPPPPGFAGNFHPPYPAGIHGTFPLPPGPTPPLAPPPGFFPRHSATMHDSFSSISHRPDQVQHTNGAAAGRSSLPPKPSTTPVPTSLAARAASSSATISAGPQLRDLKKEATAFVPSSLKRKKASGSPAAVPRINAAPSVGREGSESQEPPPATRPDLVSTLRDQLGAAPPPVKEVSSDGAAPKAKNDYQKFLEEMSDILGKPE